ncbi:MAG: transposase [Planctomycetes bacterium]|nr:transposase [Planctomycetota bacterium]
MPLVRHQPRAAISGRAPLHVTLRLRHGCPTLRTHDVHVIVRSAIAASAVRPGFRIVHYAALADHVHLVCEASSADALARSVKGLAVCLARRLNAHWRRRGRLFAGRFHARELCTPREVHHALRYVLANAHHHGLVRPGELDPCSSAAAFVAADATLETGLARPRTWLLRTGWRRHGPLELTR